MVSTGFFRLLGGFPNAVIYYNLFDFLAVGSGGYYTLTDSIFLLGNALDGFGGWLRARLYPHGSMFHGYYIGFAYEKSWITYTNKSLPTAQDDAYEAITVDFGHHSDLGYHFSISQSIGIDYTIHVSNAKISSHHTATESAGMHLSLGINLNYAFSL